MTISEVCSMRTVLRNLTAAVVSLVVFAAAMVFVLLVPSAAAQNRLVIGTLGAPPAPGTVAELDYVEAAIELILRRTPITAPGRSVRFVRFDANGSATGAISGGGRDGLTPATAYGVRHTADLRSLMASVTSGPNWTWYLRRGDTLRVDTGNLAGSQIDLPAVDNFSFSSYIDPALTAGTHTAGDRARLPQLRGTLAPYSGDWTASTAINAAYTAIWHRTESNVVYHVLYAETDPVDGRAYGLGTNTIRWYGRLAAGTTLDTALTAMQADAGQDSAVYDTTNQRLFVRPRAARATNWATNSRVEAVVSTTRGISTSNVNNVRIDSIAAIGWGMNSTVGVSQAYAIHLTHHQNNVAAVTNSIAAYTGHHAYGQLVTSAGLTGGTTLWQGNFSGWTQGDQTGNSTTAVCYTEGGRNEVIYADERLGFGNLMSVNGGGSSGTGTTAAPIGVAYGWYSHAGASAPGPDLSIIYRCRIDTEAMAAGGSFVAIGGSDPRGNAARPNPELATSWRSRVIQSTQPPGPLAALITTTDTAFVSSRIAASMAPSPASVLASFAGGSTNNVLYLACEIALDFRTRTGTADTFFAAFTVGTTPGGDPAIIFSHCAVTFKGHRNQSMHLLLRQRTSAGLFERVTATNTAFTFEGVYALSVDTNGTMIRNRAPAVGGTGGQEFNGYFGNRDIDNIISAGTNEFFGINNTRSPTLLGSPFITGSTFVRGGVPYIRWLRPGVDLDGRPADMAWIGPSVPRRAPGRQ
ncbi:MAG: hypothetical protein ACK5X3_07875 [Pseudomonadota bacterium]